MLGDSMMSLDTGLCSWDHSVIRGTLALESVLIRIPGRSIDQQREAKGTAGRCDEPSAL